MIMIMIMIMIMKIFYEHNENDEENEVFFIIFFQEAPQAAIYRREEDKITNRQLSPGHTA